MILTAPLPRKLLLQSFGLLITIIFLTQNVESSIAVTRNVETNKSSNDGACVCDLKEKPDVSAKADTARWMVHSLDWGVVSTISTLFGQEQEQMVPFGNVYSFVDGSCDKSTGIPYFYGTYMDQTFKDTVNNDQISLALSESSLSSVCAQRQGLDSCMIGDTGDPENPPCARLTLTGRLITLDENDASSKDEYEFAKNALFERHPAMAEWPSGHGWVIGKIDIQNIWLIDYFGGAAVLDPKDYFGVELSASGPSSLSS